ncbi:AAA family ATPase [Robinsoniella sp. KNHs210]|uniref:AAA family ATPase n=1 Tax=Robinsoniella sp. KNHs210 TaxID=1469950 RepID=UPI00048818CF|nr:AAA family ATPase [Robinsoniella sp. KNHs210]
MELKKLPVGIDDFKKIILQGYYYVDKTLLIKELIDLKGEVNLFTRPRRFGKTLNMSMLQYFFEISEENNKEIFLDLKIARTGEQYMKYQGKYPVINLTLKGAKQANFEYAILSIKRAISSEFQRHRKEVLEYEAEKDRILKILDAEGDTGVYLDSIQLLSKCLYEYYQTPVIILIDEYDVPLENAYFSGFYNEMVFFVRSLFESALKTNKYLEFAVMTGCLRISKESIFTGLNNLEIISILSVHYSEHFGFTEIEIDDMLKYYGLEEKKEAIKDWYDGYLFGNTEVYNPWSIVRYVKDSYYGSHGFPISYWGTTSSNSIVRTMVEKANDLQTKSDLEMLMQGDEIEKPVHEDVTYDEIYNSTNNLWNFMFFTGYLKKVSERFDDNGDHFITLKIPNKEVAYIFRHKIMGWFQEMIQSRNLQKLYLAILRSDEAEVEQELKQLLRDTISYEDYNENFYHGFLLGCLSGMSDYYVKSNRESGDGRSDIIIRHPDFNEKAVIIELKCTASPRKMEDKCQEALNQIEVKHYDDELIEEGYEDIIKYGIAFCKKNCLVRVKK